MYTTYTGERVRLRPHQSKDEGLSMLKEIHLGLVPGWGEQWCPPQAVAEGWDESGWMDHENAVFAIERLDTCEVAGYETVTPPESPSLTGWIATYIRDAHQRQGFGIEAKRLAMSYLFEHYPCDNVAAITLSNHTRALRGLQLSGMREEGRALGCTLSEGSWVDKVFWTLTRAEWEQQDCRHAIIKR